MPAMRAVGRATTTPTASLGVSTSGGGAARGGVRSGHPRVILRGESGIELVIPFAPPLQHDGLAARFEELDRYERKPLLTRVGPSLRRYSADFVFAKRDSHGAVNPQLSIERELQILRSLARTSERVRWVNFGASEGGSFRITNYSVRDVRRQAGTNDITVAEVHLELVEVSDAAMRVGPVTGGVAPAAPAPDTATVTATPLSWAVTSGDTLTSIGARAARDTSIATISKIAVANGIVDPTSIRTGQILKIPT